MKRIVSALRAITLLFAVGIFGLSSVSAQSQTSGRQGGRGANCQNAGTSQAGNTSTATQGSSAVGTFAATNPANFQFQYNQIMAQRAALRNSAYARQSSSTGRQSQTGNQASGSVSAQLTSSNELFVQWSGDPSNVQRVYFATMDSNGQVLEQRAISQLPVQAQLSLTDSATNYAVKVQYSNGTAKTFQSRIR